MSRTAGPSKPRGENAFVLFVRRYRDDRVAFVREVLQADPDTWQEEALRALDAGETRLSIRSGHGVGKSTFLAWVLVHFILTRYPSKAVCTAPSSAQLFDALFAELKRWVNALPPALRELLDVTSDRVALKGAPSEAFISARTSRAETPEAMAGVHADHVLLIADEASGIPEPVFESAAGSMSTHGAITILTGNPVRGSGFFYRTHTDPALTSRWWHRGVSCVSSRRVTPEFIEDMQARYGEDSNAYRVRVLGEFPTSDDDTLIPLELVEAAQQRDVGGQLHPEIVWGLDPARMGDDSATLAKRHGNLVPEPIKAWRKKDTMELVGLVHHEWNVTPARERPSAINVDAIGIGAGVADRLRELGLPAVAVNVSESPAVSIGPDGTRCYRLRDELWSLGKAWLATRNVRLPADDRLKADLTTPKFSFTSDGRLKVEDKPSMKRRTRRSPDWADAFLLTFAGVASVAAGFVGGASPYGNKLPEISTDWVV